MLTVSAKLLYGRDTMKWFWGIVGGLVVTVVGGLALDYWKQGFQQVVTNQEVRAEWYSGPYYPYTGVNSSSHVPGIRNLKVGELRSEGVYETIFGSRKDNTARIAIQNRTGKAISNLRIDFRDLGLPADVVVTRKVQSGSDAFIPNAEVVVVGRMEPGDSRVIYVWSLADLSNIYNAREVRIYGNDDIIPIKMAERQWSYIGSGNFDKIDSAIDLAIYISMTTLVIILLGGVVVLTNYVDVLLKNPQFYISERLNYEIKGSMAFKPRLLEALADKKE